jgi:mannose-6-phosphate isomerase
MDKPKTIFCDIDGTLLQHAGPASQQTTINNSITLPNTLEAINLWDKLGYKVILTTGRKESLRTVTERILLENKIVYDQLIMGLGGGDRILINDRKPDIDRNTCYSINLPRDKGINHYDFRSKYVTISDNQPKQVEKPWGRENLIEYNDNYVVKKLFMKAGECCSMQYHELKKETIYVLYGKLKLYIGKDIENLEEKIMLAGDSISISPFTIHRMEGIEDSEYIECSTNELWDVVRLRDKYSREGETEKNYV